MAAETRPLTDGDTTMMSRRMPPADSLLDEIMAGARVVAGVIARSLVHTDGHVTLPQLRVLVVMGERGILSLNDVADVLGVHPSNATRLVDRLVNGGLIDRRQDPANRRQLQLTLTAEGADLVNSVMQHRRESLAEIVATLPVSSQRDLAQAMGALNRASQNHTNTETWAVPVGPRRT
ncbi:MAG: MarR family winged helix-turn-helix transcriptional regulator [Actinomycetales bacterium]